MANEQKVAVSVDLFNSIVEYLQRQPYGAVAQLIDAIKNDVQAINVEEPDDESTTSE